MSGCRTAETHRKQADTTAHTIINAARKTAVPAAYEPFTLDRPSEILRRRLVDIQSLPSHGVATRGVDALPPPPHWPKDAIPQGPTTNSPITSVISTNPVVLSLVDAIKIGARHSRQYQTTKEDVFRAALDLDLERNVFRSTWAGTFESELSSNRSADDPIEGVGNNLDLSVGKMFQNGVALSSRLAIDLVKLLTGDRDSALGLSADATISIPLLRGAGRHIIREALTQAERNVLYAIYALEDYKRDLAVQIASDFLGVLQASDQAYNAQRNYATLRASAERARALAKAGRLPEIQVDQAHQDKLRAYDRLVSARQRSETTLDQFKFSLGLPPDAAITLKRDSFNTLIEAARTDLDDTTAKAPRDTTAITLALKNRLDMRTAAERVYDIQRSVVIAADALQAEISLLGSASAGNSRSLATASQGNADLKLSKGIFASLLSIDLPLERTAERMAFRKRLLDLDAAVRNAQQQEDTIKLEIRNGLRRLKASRENIDTQLEAVRLAERRQKSTDLFLKAGRAQMRDVLEAEESLLSARNALTTAVIDYRIAELRLQRDAGVLRVTDNGLVREHPLTPPGKSPTSASTSPDAPQRAVHNNFTPQDSQMPRD